jgi:mevalonate kinase
VLHGALAIGLPTKKGQKMVIKNARGSDLIWEALDRKGEVWFDAQISLYDFSAIKTSDEDIAKKLKKLLKAAVRDNSEFLSTWSGFKVETQLEFDRNWGLGSSSTLVSNIAQWADINPFHLFFSVYNGSGYDIACAEADDAILYQLGEEQLHFHEIDFNPAFKNNLFFIHRGKKQDSEDAIKIHGKKFRNNKEVIEQITDISDKISKVSSFSKFRELIDLHEQIIGETIGLTPVKLEEFEDFDGSIKSLGAWGGDMILAASDQGEEYVKDYFTGKALETVINYDDLIQSS